MAVHLACQSLRLGESRTAIAAGVNAILWPELTEAFCRARMLSPTGRCHTFDAAADGYVRGEGCGVVVLQRLGDALAQGDRVLAVIRGSAVNQDGRTSGLTVPSGPAQEELIREALRRARIEPRRVSYLEAHGTGTPLGDPIEVRAIAAALGAGRNRAEPLAIGSVKTNLGHLEAAAGVAGLIKVVLALQHGELPATLHFRTPSPHIAWNELPVEVVTARRPWPATGEPRVAGVSAFGFSGTNAHVVVEEAPRVPAPTGGDPRLPYLLPLSARGDAALGHVASGLAAGLVGLGHERLADVCFTAGAGRAHLTHRAAVVGRDAAELAAGLEAVVAGREADGVFRGAGRVAGVPQVAFLFTGQGAQYPGMGRRLAEMDGTFRRVLEECAEALDPHLERPLRAILAQAPAAPQELDEARYAQPAVFAVEVALSAMLRDWGVEPAAVIGHSLGEYAAACVAGVLRLEDAARLVAVRGRVMDALPRGAMAAIWMSEEAIRPLVADCGAGQVAIAAINAPDQVVVSGLAPAVDAVCARVEREGVRVRRLTMTRPFHSPLVEPSLAELAAEAARLEHREPRIAVVSNVTGRLAGPGELGPAYWARHARQPVRFAEGLAALGAEGFGVFVEIGPHPTLIGLGPQCLAGAGAWIPTLRRDQDDWQALRETLAALYTQGVDVDWAAVDRGQERRLVTLPTYPFQRRRHWAGSAASTPPVSAPAGVWEAVAAAGRRQMAQAPLDLAVGSYPAKWHALNELATAYAAAALAGLGCFTRPGERRTLDALAGGWAPAPARRHLLSRLCRRLVETGLLERHGEELVSPAPLSAEPDEALKRQAKAALADAPALFEYVQRCGARLGAILAGGESPLETLFPGGSLDTAEYLYRDWSVARYMNGLAAAVVEAWVRSQPTGLALRVLEVGAGTGGTSSAVLPMLPADRTTYAFTDVSPFFFEHAARALAAYPFVRHALLDLERDPCAQGWEPGSVHLVVAANVLHATRDLDRTLEHVRTLLAPGGMLVAYEATEHHPWLDVTTGLIEGWHAFADRWRNDQPLLEPDRWAAALEAHGFAPVGTFPTGDSPAAVLGQHIIAALVPGLTGATAEAPVLTGPTAAGLAEPSAGGSPTEELRRRLVEAAEADRHEILVGHVRQVVARVLRLDAPESLDRRSGLMDLGIDSLMALQLRKRLGAGLTRPLPATLIFDHPSIDAIARLLGRELAVGAADESAAGRRRRRARPRRRRPVG